MNKIDQLFAEKKKNILSVYFTAGYPKIDSLTHILPAIEDAGIDLVEIGMPFSDPLADGPVIQASSQRALDNGMTLDKLFKQLNSVEFNIPVILMGYLNPVLRFGLPSFLQACHESGVSGLILPDLPVEDYLRQKDIFDKQGQHLILLVTPQCSDERIKYLARHSGGFVYVVASSATTGTRSFKEADKDYFRQLNQLNTNKPSLIGFGIQDADDYKSACQWANGGIIGSQFIRILDKCIGHDANSYNQIIREFASSIR